MRDGRSIRTVKKKPMMKTILQHFFCTSIANSDLHVQYIKQ